MSLYRLGKNVTHCNYRIVNLFTTNQVSIINDFDIKKMIKYMANGSLFDYWYNGPCYMYSIHGYWNKTRFLSSAISEMRQFCQNPSWSVGLPYASTVDDSNILMHFGGVDRNSLIRILNPNYEDQGICYDEPSIIKNSPYYDYEKLINELNTKTNNFNILSLNCESINSKFDQINIIIEQFKRNGCTFNAVCLQESWLSDDTDTSLFQLDGYNLLLRKVKKNSNRGGLIVYLKDTIDYKLIDIQANSNIWEGQLIEIEHEHVGNKILSIL